MSEKESQYRELIRSTAQQGEDIATRFGTQNRAQVALAFGKLLIWCQSRLL